MIPSRKLTERTPVRLKAKIISGDEIYPGFIQNVSESGIRYFIESVIKAEKDFVPKKMIELNFKLPSGETVNLDCEIIWSSRKTPDDKDLIIGIKILKPPQKYKKFVKKLKTDYFNKKRKQLLKKQD
jgi:hypothetical protein